MPQAKKTAPLQIRLSPKAKLQLVRAARRSGKDLSSDVLDKVLPASRQEFDRIVRELQKSDRPSYPFAALHDLIANSSRSEFSTTFGDPPALSLDPLLNNMVAAMIEHAAVERGEAIPEWTSRIDPLTTPYFASSLRSLRLHLLTRSPPAFRRRNLFVDSTIGDRI